MNTAQKYAQSTKLEKEGAPGTLWKIIAKDKSHYFTLFLYQQTSVPNSKVISFHSFCEMGFDHDVPFPSGNPHNIVAQFSGDSERLEGVEPLV